MFDIGGAVETRRSLVDRLRAQHRALAVAQADEVFTLTELYLENVRVDQANGYNLINAGDGAAPEAAVAIRMSEAMASGLVDIGLALNDDLPLTQSAFAVGDIDLPQVRVLVDALSNVDPEVIAAVEERLVDAARRQNPSQLRRTCRRVLAAIDPHGERGRRERRIEERDVRIRPTSDGVSFLDGILPAVGAQTLIVRLREMGRQVCCHDPRSAAQRRADAIVALADGTGLLTCTCGRDDCTATTVAESRKPLVHIGVSLETLLGLSDAPGHLAGVGAIDADLVRTLAANGSWKLIVKAAEAAIQRLFGQDPHAYRLTAAFQEWIRAQDGHCRFPGCTVSAAFCDIDHNEPFDHDSPKSGGKSTPSNTACLCRRHHRIKTQGDNADTGWRVRQLDGRRLEWTTPTGDIHITEPAGAAYLHPGPIPHTDPPPEPEREPFGAIICTPELRKKLLNKPSEAEIDLADILEMESPLGNERIPGLEIYRWNPDWGPPPEITYGPLPPRPPRNDKAPF